MGSSWYDLTHGRNLAWRDVTQSQAGRRRYGKDRPSLPADPQVVQEARAEVAQIRAELANLEQFYPNSVYVQVLKAKVARLCTDYAIE